MTQHERCAAGDHRWTDLGAGEVLAFASVRIRGPAVYCDGCGLVAR